LLVYRSFYPRGGKSEQLKLGKNYMRARDYEGAIRVYEGLAEHPESKVRGRAQFNLAVAEEAMGRFERSLTAARAAAVTLGNGRARRYVMTIEHRIRERDRVQEQMAPAPEEDPAMIQGPRRPGTGTPTPPSDGTMNRPRP
jgi:tetratricopeptide (TPR) repeat protein